MTSLAARQVNVVSFAAFGDVGFDARPASNLIWGGSLPGMPRAANPVVSKMGVTSKVFPRRSIYRQGAVLGPWENHFVAIVRGRFATKTLAKVV